MGSMHHLREFLIRRRFALGLSQRELARHARLNAGTIASIESGRVQRFPSLATLEALARGLQVEMALLVDLARESSTPVREEASSLSSASVEYRGEIHPLSAEERLLLLECEDAGIAGDLVASLRLLESSTDERRVTLLLLQALATELRRRMPFDGRVLST